MGETRRKFDQDFREGAFIAAQRDACQIPQSLSCRVLGVSRSWFCKWRGGALPPRAARRQLLAAEVRRLFEMHSGKYGSPRITADLRDAGWRVSENTVAALMRELGLAARRKKRRRSTTRPGKGRWRTPDLVKRDFPAAQLNRKWYGDGTEIPTDEGKLHLASVLDMGSRRVLGFALREHHDAQLAYGALAMAVTARRRRGRRRLAHRPGQRIHREGVPPGLPAPVGPPVHGTTRLSPRQRRHRVLAPDPRVRAAAPGALRHQGSSQGRRLDRGLQHRPPTLGSGHDVARPVRAGPRGLESRLTCPRFSAAHDPPVLGHVKVVPPRAIRPCGGSTQTAPALRQLHGS
jgi:hypothetical protein